MTCVAILIAGLAFGVVLAGLCFAVAVLFT